MCKLVRKMRPKDKKCSGISATFLAVYHDINMSFNWLCDFEIIYFQCFLSNSNPTTYKHAQKQVYTYKHTHMNLRTHSRRKIQFNKT